MVFDDSSSSTRFLRQRSKPTAAVPPTPTKKSVDIPSDPLPLSSIKRSDSDAKKAYKYEQHHSQQYRTGGVQKTVSVSRVETQEVVRTDQRATQLSVASSSKGVPGHHEWEDIPTIDAGDRTDYTYSFSSSYRKNNHSPTVDNPRLSRRGLHGFADFFTSTVPTSETKSGKSSSWFFKDVRSSITPLTSTPVVNHDSILSSDRSLGGTPTVAKSESRREYRVTRWSKSVAVTVWTVITYIVLLPLLLGKSLTDKGARLSSSTWSHVSQVPGGLYSLASTISTRLVTVVTTIGHYLWMAISTVCRGVWSSIATVARKSGSAVVTIGRTSGSAVKSVAQKSGSAVVGTVKKSGLVVSEVAEKSGSAVATAGRTSSSAVSTAGLKSWSAIATSWSFVSSVLSGLWSLISSAVSRCGSALWSVVAFVAAAIASLPGKLASGVRAVTPNILKSRSRLGDAHSGVLTRSMKRGKKKVSFAGLADFSADEDEADVTDLAVKHPNEYRSRPSPWGALWCGWCWYLIPLLLLALLLGLLYANTDEEKVRVRVEETKRVMTRGFDSTASGAIYVLGFVKERALLAATTVSLAASGAFNRTRTIPTVPPAPATDTGLRDNVVSLEKRLAMLEGRPATPDCPCKFPDLSGYASKDEIASLISGSAEMKALAADLAALKFGQNERDSDSSKRLQDMSAQMATLVALGARVVQLEAASEQKGDAGVSAQRFEEEMAGLRAQLLTFQKSGGEEGFSKFKRLEDKLTALAAGLNTATSESTHIKFDAGDDARMRVLILQLLDEYQRNKTGKADHALESSGGSIVDYRCTTTFRAHTRIERIWRIPLWFLDYSARVIIQDGVVPGECWAFEGSMGSVVLRLSGHVAVSEVLYEHIPRELSPDGHIDSAPKDFQVWGLRHEKDAPGVLLGNFTYDQYGTPAQSFLVENEKVKSMPFEFVELKILSNYGHPVFTCLYRFKVHGTRVKPAYNKI